MDLTTLPGYVPGFPDTMSVRQLGGLVSADGRRVRSGLLYRGSTLMNLTDQQKALVDGFGLKFMLDLRAKGEAVDKDDYVPQGTEYLRVGGMLMDGVEVDFSPEGIERISKFFADDPGTFMRNLYVSMMFGNPAVHTLVERFAAGQAPLYFHCSAGKDRTGVCAAVLLMLLDVPDDVIVQEFLLTNQYRSSIITMRPEELPSWVSEADRANWASINGVKEEDLRSCMAAVDERYPSREAYFLDEFGLDQAALASLRDRYLQ